MKITGYSRFTWLLFFMAVSFSSIGQEKVYHLQKVTDPVLVASSAITAASALYLLESQDDPGEEVILSLEKNKVWKPERWVLQQSIASREQFELGSDLGAGIAFLAPALLLTSEKMRQEWFSLLVLYTEAQLFTYNLTHWVKLSALRYRPVAYYDEIPLSEKNEADNVNSFFSGHTSTTATATFFMARVICDFHPELGGKQYLVYTAALLPPVIIGTLRVKALKHFPTDTVVGLATGALSGIFVPYFHKKKSDRVVIYPMVGGYSGIAMSITF